MSRKTKSPPKKMGRPNEVSQKLSGPGLIKLMKFKPTVADVAGFFNCSKRMVQKFIEDEYKMTFSEFRDIHMGSVRLKLVQIAISKALSGKDNEMLKYCLNNLAGWSYNPLPKDDNEEIEDMVF